jgi:hypothetical protein
MKIRDVAILGSLSSLFLCAILNVYNANAQTPPTGEEALAALYGYTAYFGTYTIDEKARIVNHNQWGTVQPGPVNSRDRAYEFAPGDRLILKGGNSVLTWERVK